MEQTSTASGRVAWRELMTADLSRARTFYTGLLGWDCIVVPAGAHPSYVLVRAGERPVACIWEIEHGSAARPSWMSYVSVPDVDQTAAIALQCGGKTLVAPRDIEPGSYAIEGRFAVLEDPAGAFILAFRGRNPTQPSGVPTVGELCWETLGTNDLARATKFYGKVFGWQVFERPAGRIFCIDSSDAGRVADVQLVRNYAPHWLTYVAVERVERIVGRVARLGGTVRVPRFDLPGLGRIAVIADPSGAELGLIEVAPGN